MMETNQSGAMKTLLVVTAAFGAHNRHPFGPVPTACLYTISTNAVAGGAFVGTLATHALAPAPALMASFGGAEKIEPAFKVCAL